METTDPELVRRAADGEHAAFETLARRHAKYLFSLAYSLLGSAADAEDVVQESLTGVYRSLGKFQGRASVRAWMRGIVIRQAARLHRGRALRHAKSIEDSQADATVTDDAAMRIGTTVCATDRKMDIEAFLQRLSNPHRQVIVLREVHGLSYEEIADALQVPRGTVESRLFRARADLAAMMKGYL